jgi:hypothetical protein
VARAAPYRLEDQDRGLALLVNGVMDLGVCHPLDLNPVVSLREGRQRE